MKILISIPYFEPAWGYGGPPRIVSELSKELAKHHTVRIITTDVLDKKKRVEQLHETEGNREIFRYRTISNMLAWKTKIILPRGLNTTTLINHVSWADFIYLSDLRHALNAKIFPFLKKFQKPYCLSAFGQIQKPKDSKYLLKVLFDVLIGRKLVQQAKALLAQTQHEVQDYQTMGGKKERIHIIPLAAQKTIEIISEDTINAFCQKYHIEKTTKLLLFVGRIHKLKGIDTIMYALNKLPLALKHQTKLIIVGRDDGYQPTMRKCIDRCHLRDNIIETGPLYGAENAVAYQVADLFVFAPDFYEETSLAAVRALSFGVPVITVPQAEMPYLDAMHAGITTQNTPVDLANAITTALTKENLLPHMKQSAKELFRTHYTIESMAEKIEKIAEK
ncbi:MAG: hypothetical protein A3B74_00475 [Candidatus Kerfeldbacteria bacterium RIFCSPHIGHO2_02_FULL_42_14]|uniref:Glycosyl transferase family 1 domain-containing protein n=1 Tax=Candidatus Kerfeldbacteria bacterium RIFCSPHIGHO2_02_FULL_42_14 TaxID=1798540 RepID=A0A1G2ATG0_9BACT|nr:MAG: hypothetical protein A3B74_00475 [Candidatus Kerfeldbacteria bacterium RIFCSPHIGHO2_02_FULL_42_14]OGY81253.1 MAG: hypothetical protein A3E60_02265 [Candidatus Kerfeldbacteria bacterium RIFCSPHIGHO2_12_FULL_42_13]OGY83528.1 MAG: hypothetical protein A3I91_02700 [Candidatus Kerfeldbacteria bacterium RIFCSPLOWO2_02_FULL_42_19]OGY85771.1 MAG: hypothetical protein A3G01_03920 [Candidatus Kerfeldbacteria bacterium RIFCSPLOWO2_12_FULL_43_9]